MSWFENGRHYLNLYLLIRDELAMDLGYLVSNGRYIDCADNGFASFACLSSHLDSCLDSLIEMSSSRFRMKIKKTLKVHFSRQ